MKYFIYFVLFFNLLQAEEFTILAEDFPPFQYERDGELRGVSTAVVREILKQAGHIDNIEIQSWSKAYEIIKQNSGYVLFSMTRTQEREPFFKWVGPVAKATNSFYKKANSDIEIKSLEDAKGYKIGVGKGQATAIMLEAKGFDNLKYYDEEKYIYPALISGEIDLIPANDLLFNFRLKQIDIDGKEIVNTGYKIYDNELYIAFSKDTTDDLIHYWQHILDMLVESYEYEAIYKEAITKAYKDFSVEAPEEFKESDVIKVTKNSWDMFGSSQDVDLDMFEANCVDVVWIYRDGNWIQYIPNSQKELKTITKNRAFWIKGKEDCYLNLQK